MATIKGGKKLEDALKELGRKLSVSGTLQVGFLADAKYPDGTQVAMVAAINNFGAPAAGIPARPFFTKTVKDKSPEWPQELGHILVANNLNAETSLKLMGKHIQEQIVDSIENGPWEPNAESTIRGKGFDSPLQHTGFMKSRVDYVIVTKS